MCNFFIVFETLDTFNGFDRILLIPMMFLYTEKQNGIQIERNLFSSSIVDTVSSVVIANPLNVSIPCQAFHTLESSDNL